MNNFKNVLYLLTFVVVFSYISTPFLINNNQQVAISNETSYKVVKGDNLWNIGYKLNVDNIKIDGNIISSTDNNGNINLNCNGTGKVEISNDLNVTGTIYGAINGTVSGNAASATILETARTIGGVSLNGSQNIDL